MNASALARLASDPLTRAARAALAGPERAWVVGGALRDLALGSAAPLADLDLAVLGPAAPYARRLARRLGAAFVTLDEGHEVYRLVCPARAGAPARQVDVARVQGPGIEAALGRRDFTVNAMAVPLAQGRPELLDPFAGLADASRRLLKAVRPEAFDEDPLRTLRVFRIAAQCALTPEARTVAWAKARRALLKGCAAERVRAEVMGLLGSADSARWLRDLDGAGLLTAVFPELEPSRRCALAYYGRGGVLTHALATVARVDFLLASLERVWPRHAAGVRETLASCPGRAPGHPAPL
ncbi:MAG: CCA tRNA nucleotidyltransferase, partial [Elusimicrobia bacterium]|nr:CCA tRNA nucleotidyltransferase [Elusimicrobiota bacterium]